jgi:hypothetical protein
MNSVLVALGGSVTALVRSSACLAALAFESCMNSAEQTRVSSSFQCCSAAVDGMSLVEEDCS